MTETFTLDIVTPERLVVSERVEEVTAPGLLGEFGVLPGHTPFLTTLKAGPLKYKTGNITKTIVVSWGYAEVEPDKVVILAETAEKAEEIDIAKAQEKRRWAEEKLKDLSEYDENYGEIKKALEKALARLSISGEK